jgi:hypothetical protein
MAVKNEPHESCQDLVDLYGTPMEEIIRRGGFKAQLQTIDYLTHRIRTSARNGSLCAMLESIDVRSRYIICRTLILKSIKKCKSLARADRVEIKGRIALRSKDVYAVVPTLLVFVTGVDAATTWPDRPIRFVVHVAAGGGVDLMARIAMPGRRME